MSLFKRLFKRLAAWEKGRDMAWLGSSNRSEQSTKRITISCQVEVSSVQKSPCEKTRLPWSKKLTQPRLAWAVVGCTQYSCRLCWKRLGLQMYTSCHNHWGGFAVRCSNIFTHVIAPGNRTGVFTFFVVFMFSQLLIHNAFQPSSQRHTKDLPN